MLAAAGAAALAASALSAALFTGGSNDGAASRPSAAATTERSRPAPAPPSRETAAPVPIVRFTVGSGARSATIVRRAGSTGPRPTVVFLHGWGLTQPSAYAGWMRHLAATGNTVIAPRYQRGERADPRLVRGRMLAGLRRAFTRAPVESGSLVVAGHSAGAALAADYAGIARAVGLPRAAGVFSVYPGRAILGYPGGIPQVDPGRIPGTTRLLALAGANDAVVGRAPAQALVAAARRVPPRRRRFLLVSTPSVADHLAPARGDAAARAAFWRRLDRFIVAARSR